MSSKAIVEQLKEFGLDDKQISRVRTHCRKRGYPFKDLKKVCCNGYMLFVFRKDGWSIGVGPSIYIEDYDAQELQRRLNKALSRK